MSGKKIRSSVLSFLNDVEGFVADELESRRIQAEKDFADFYRSAQSTTRELDAAKKTTKKVRDDNREWRRRAVASEQKLNTIQQKLDSTENKLHKVTSQTRDLFHFTAAGYLPDILKSGITRGVLHVDMTRSYSEQPQAACLTSNGHHFDQSWDKWDELCVDYSRMEKTRIRLTVRVPDSSLTSFSDVQSKYRIDDQHIRLLDHLGQRHHWYYAFSGVSPDAIIKVEVLNGLMYEEVSGDELDDYLAAINEEIEATLDIEDVEDGFWRGVRLHSLKPGVTSSFLFDKDCDDDDLEESDIDDQLSA